MLWPVGDLNSLENLMQPLNAANAILPSAWRLYYRYVYYITTTATLSLSLSLALSLSLPRVREQQNQGEQSVREQLMVSV
jgi:hypothetical protein